MIVRRLLPAAAGVVALVPGVAICQEADNMVFNPSFEERVACPQRIEALGIMREPEAWWQPTAGSSDYFNLCGGRECVVPRNKMGFQAPHSGDAYCGIYCSQEDYREYLQTELRAPLEAGRRYRVGFYVSLADKSPHAVATLGAFFSPTPVGDSLRGILMERDVSDLDDHSQQSIATPYEPQVENPADRVLVDMRGWMLVEGEFTARGGERYMTIGNFRPFNQSNVVETGNAAAVLPGAYYYVDDVIVCPVGGAAAALPTAAEVPTVDEVRVVEDIFFEVDRSELLPQSYRALQGLLALLTDNPGLRLELRGHTDSVGTLAHNQRLSEARAKAVVDYLVSHGIQRRRLTFVGLGETSPVDSNDTPEGRARNRRVEYRVLGL